MKKRVVIVKPTNNCNLRCKYCYTQETASRGMMSTSTLENIIKKFVKFNEREGYFTHFLWHGGEPLLAGLDFYKRAREIQKRVSKFPVTNSIQTNGISLDEEMIDWFIKEDFRVGLSIDGPKNIHDTNRIYGNGRGSFDQIMKNVNLMKEKGLELRVIMVLNKKNVDKLEEIYSFFKEHRMNFKVHPLVYAGRLNLNDDLKISQEEYGKAMINLFRIWFNDSDYKIDIEPLYQIIGNLITSEPLECSFLPSCQERFISVAPNGDVYPCGRFDGILSLKYGNINANSVEQIFASPVRQELLQRRVETIEDCTSCKWRKICNSGCMNNAYNAGNIFQKDDYCTAYKMIFEHVSRTLKDYGLNEDE